MEDRMVELTRFTKVSEAEILANLLKSEGVDCYVRDGFMNQIYNGLDLGGVKVELLEKDLERATEIMKDYGYMSSADGSGLQTPGISDFSENQEMIVDSDNAGIPDDLDDSATSEENEVALAEYERQKAKLSRNLTIIGVLIVIVVALIILLNRHFNG